MIHVLIIPSMLISQGNFKGARTLKINFQKHCWNYIMLFKKINRLDLFF